MKGVPLTSKFLGKTKYKYVSMVMHKDGSYTYQISVLGICRQINNEREAAIKVDKILISKGKEPVNILKRTK